MRFTDRKTHFTDRIPLLSIRSIRTDRHMAYTDRYGAGVLDNPHIRKCVQLKLENVYFVVSWKHFYHKIGMIDKSFALY